MATPGTMHSTIERYRVDRRHIAFLRFTLEAYEGLAIMSTVDPAKAVIELKIAPGCENELRRILVELGTQMLIEPQPYDIEEL